jgi:hypothetical protein
LRRLTDAHRTSSRCSWIGDHEVHGFAEGAGAAHGEVLKIQLDGVSWGRIIEGDEDLASFDGYESLVVRALFRDVGPDQDVSDLIEGLVVWLRQGDQDGCVVIAGRPGRETLDHCSIHFEDFHDGWKWRGSLRHA